MPSGMNRGRVTRRWLGKSLLVSSLAGRVRKVRNVRKVSSLIFGRTANSENKCCGNYFNSRAQALKTFRTFRTFRSSAGRTKRRKLRELDLVRMHIQRLGQDAAIKGLDPVHSRQATDLRWILTIEEASRARRRWPQKPCARI